MQPGATTEPEDRESIRTWLAAWGDCVAARNFQTAKALFHPDVVGFGTYSDFVVGLDNLSAQQWQKVWPTIGDFRFDVDGMWTDVSDDRMLAHLATRWSSTGVTEDGGRFDRPGRCTVTLRRAAVGEAWLGTHTHFSLARGVPPLSHGN